MARNQMYNASADVYAFGILLFEVITELPPSRTFRYRVTNAGFTLLEDELRGAVKPGCPAALEALAFSCCETKPAKRPDAAQNALNSSISFCRSTRKMISTVQQN
jgi:serine/threonine protein kinase